MKGAAQKPAGLVRRLAARLIKLVLLAVGLLVAAIALFRVQGRLRGVPERSPRGRGAERARSAGAYHVHSDALRRQPRRAEEIAGLARAARAPVRRPDDHNPRPARPGTRTACC